MAWSLVASVGFAAGLWLTIIVLYLRNKELDWSLIVILFPAAFLELLEAMIWKDVGKSVADCSAHNKFFTKLAAAFWGAQTLCWVAFAATTRKNHPGGIVNMLLRVLHVYATGFYIWFLYLHVITVPPYCAFEGEHGLVLGNAFDRDAIPAKSAVLVYYLGMIAPLPFLLLCQPYYISWPVGAIVAGSAYFKMKGPLDEFSLVWSVPAALTSVWALSYRVVLCQTKEEEKQQIPTERSALYKAVKIASVPPKLSNVSIAFKVKTVEKAPIYDFSDV